MKTALAESQTNLAHAQIATTNELNERMAATVNRLHQSEELEVGDEVVVST